LDHVQITVESHEPEIHDHMVRRRGAWEQTIAGLKNALDTPLFVMTNTTMLRDNAPVLHETLDFLAETGVPTVGARALSWALVWTRESWLRSWRWRASRPTCTGSG
jgi:MoaA/NifB/PqqE/SkfB family radical SAM enzyme